MNLDRVELIELNEAFAAQAIYCIKELGINEAITNVNGGAIALGHPLGCTGAKLTTQLAYEMQERKARWGLVSMCIGFGMEQRLSLRERTTNGKERSMGKEKLLRGVNSSSPMLCLRRFLHRKIFQRSKTGGPVCGRIRSERTPRSESGA